MLQKLGFHKCAIAPEILKNMSNEKLLRYNKQVIQGAKNITQAMYPHLQQGNKYVGLGLAEKHTPEYLKGLSKKTWQNVLDNIAEIRTRKI